METSLYTRGQQARFIRLLLSSVTFSAGASLIGPEFDSIDHHGWRGNRHELSVIGAQASVCHRLHS